MKSRVDRDKKSNMKKYKKFIITAIMQELDIDKNNVNEIENERIRKKK